MNVSTEESAPPLYAQGVAQPPAGAEPIWLTTRDGVRLRAAFWPASASPARGALLLFQGRTEFIEKYYEPIEHFLRLGFAVMTLDWRGQGLSDRPLKDGGLHLRGYVNDFADFQLDADAASEALAERAPEGPWVLAAHSMGGAVAARLLMRQEAGGAEKPPGRDFVAALLSAPMVGLYGSGGGVAARLAASFAVGVGLGRGYATGSDLTYPDELAKAGQTAENPLTSDLKRFDERYVAFLRQHPDLALGGATWRWLWAARREQATLKPCQLPTLVLLGDAEMIVSPKAVRAYAAGNPNASLLFLEGDARHEVFLEADPHQARVWAAVEEFFDRNAPRPG